MERPKSKIISLFVAGSMTVLALAGCGGVQSPITTTIETTSASETTKTDASQDTTTAAASEPITIQFWNSFTGSDGDILREIVDNYSKENNKEITIEMDIMPGATLLEKLAPAIITGTAPAFVIQGNFDVPLYGKNGNMQPMDDFFDVTDCDQSDFVESALAGLQFDGSQIMIPMQWFSTYLYWNKDLFEAAGLDPETPPTTWEEMAQFAEKVTNPDKNVYGLGICISGGVSWFNSLFMANGGDVLDLTAKKSVLDSPENLASLQFIQNIVENKWAPKGTTGADLDNVMMADQLGMVINGPWMVNGLKESEINFGVTGMPAGSVKTVGIQEQSGFCIPKGTQEDAKLAAYDFIAFWNTTEIGKEWSMRNGFPPYLRSVMEDAEVKADPLVSTFSIMSEYATPFAPGIESASQMNADVLFPMIENIVAGNDCQEELTKASKGLDELLAKES